MAIIILIIIVVISFNLIKKLLNSPEKLNATINCEGTIFNITLTYFSNTKYAKISDIHFTSNGDLLHIEFKITTKVTYCFNSCGIDYYLVGRDNAMSNRSEDHMYGVGTLNKGQNYIYKGDLYGLPIDEKEYNVAVNLIGFRGYIGL